MLAFARGDDEERAFWRRTLEDLEQQPGDLERAIQLLRAHGALAETLARARTYAAAGDRRARRCSATARKARALTEAADFASSAGSEALDQVPLRCAPALAL